MLVKVRIRFTNFVIAKLPLFTSREERMRVNRFDSSGMLVKTWSDNSDTFMERDFCLWAASHVAALCIFHPVSVLFLNELHPFRLERSSTSSVGVSLGFAEY